MADPFVAALDILFTGPGSGAAVFTEAKNGAQTPIRLIRMQSTEGANFGQHQVLMSTNVFQIRRSDLEVAPLDGDLITIVDPSMWSPVSDYRIQGGPEIDAEGLTWTCPAEAR